MKIGLVCPYNMLERAGGVGEIVVNLHAGLTRKGHKVKIITPRPTGFEGSTPEDYILLGTSAKFNGGLATDGTLTFNVDSDEIKRVLNEEKFDVINFHEPWAPILARQMLQYSDTAHVGTFHANLIDSPAAKSLVNLFAPYGKSISGKLDLVTATSPVPAKVILDKDPKGKLVKELVYIPCGINLRRFQTKPASAIKHPQTKAILYVGRLEGRKGVKYLLRAYNELAKRHADVQLLVAGSGPDEQKLRDEVKNSEIPNVTFLGFISDEDKIHHLHRADVFCSPATKGEGFGVVLLEAMAAGTPIVAGDNAGYVSVMEETGAISLVNPKDTVDFARRLEIMLFNEDIRTLWQTWAKAYIKQFDYVHIVDQYEAAYKEAIKIHAKAPKLKRRFSLRRQFR
jgi:phosphatidylinositol alpha-mannosyltransferase